MLIRVINFKCLEWLGRFYIENEFLSIYCVCEW